MTEAQARAAYEALKKEVADHNAACPAIVPTQAQADRCNAWKRNLDERKAALEARLGELGVEILPPGTEPAPAQPGTPGTQPAPGQPGTQEPPPGKPGPTEPGPGQPGAQEPPPGQPGTQGSPSIAEKAIEIGQEVAQLPPGSRTATLADEITGMHLSQEQAAEATNIASKAAFGETAGIVNGPAGSKLVLPADITLGKAMMINPDGSVTVFIGDLFQFLPR